MDDDDLLTAAAEWLRSNNIEPIVIGRIAIVHRPEERRHNHELVIRFTAVLPPTPTAKD